MSGAQAPGARSTPRSFSDDLRGRSSEELVELLRSRPDVADPLPGSLSGLAGRCGDRYSVARAVDALNAAQLEVLTSVALVRPPASSASIAELVGRDCADLLKQLWTRALIWGTPQNWHLPNAVRDTILVDGGGPSVGWLYPQVVQYCADPAGLREKLTAAPQSAQDVLLTVQRQRGPVRRPQRGSKQKGLSEVGVQWLLDEQIAVPVGQELFAIPAELLALIRGGPTTDQPFMPMPREPVWAGVTRDQALVDREGAGAALTTVGLVAEVVEIIESERPRELQSGGLAVRDVSRWATHLHLTASELRLLIEVAAGARLLGVGPERNIFGGGSTLLPAPEFDSWLGQPIADRWATLADTWLYLPRQTYPPAGTEKVGNVLSPGLQAGAVVGLRLQVLEVLAQAASAAPPHSATALDLGEVQEIVRWSAPRRYDVDRPGAVRAILAEAEMLGIVAMGALTSAGRALLQLPVPDGFAGSRARASSRKAGAARVERVAPAARILDPLVPEQITSVIVQADLTVVVPGPPVPQLSQFLARLSVHQSRGSGARVLRITADSVRSAMDSGMTAEEIRAGLRKWSATALPQPLDVLIADVERRHGVLRRGCVSSYLRSQDEGLLEAILADPKLAQLGLFRLAPTVLGCPKPEAELAAGLAKRGHSPLSEDSSGALMLAIRDDRATNARWDLATTPNWEWRPPADGASLSEKVRRLQDADRRSVDYPGQKTALPEPVPTGREPALQDSHTMLAVISEAIEGYIELNVTYARRNGMASVAILPIAVAAGMLQGIDERERDHFIPLSDIVIVEATQDF